MKRRLLKVARCGDADHERHGARAAHLGVGGGTGSERDRMGPLQPGRHLARCVCHALRAGAGAWRSRVRHGGRANRTGSGPNDQPGAQPALGPRRAGRCRRIQRRLYLGEAGWPTYVACRRSAQREDSRPHPGSPAAERRTARVASDAPAKHGDLPEGSPQAAPAGSTGHHLRADSMSLRSTTRLA